MAGWVSVAVFAAASLASPASEAAAPDDVRVLTGRLCSPDPAERERTVAALAALGPPAIPEILESVVPNAARTSPEIVPWFDATVDALRRIGPPAAAPLGKALEDPRKLVQVVAAAALSALGRDAAPAAARLGPLLDSDPLIGFAAEQALRGVGEPAVPTLVRALSSSPEARRRAAKLLAELGRAADPRVESALAALPAPARAEAALEIADALVEPRDRVPYYERALAALPAAGDDAALRATRRRSLQQLVSLYTQLGQDGPGAAHARRLLELDPEDADATAAVAEFHARFGRTDEAERLYRAQLARRHDQASCGALARFLLKPLWNGRPRRDEALQALEGCAAAEPRNAAVRLEIATLYWDWAYRDAAISERDKARAVERGLAAVDAALALAPDDFQGLVYKGLLLRTKATLPGEAARREALVEEAKRLQARAVELRKRQAEPGR